MDANGPGVDDGNRDTDRRASRLAVYGLSGGKVIDDPSHEILAARTYEYAPLRFVLLDPRR